MFGLSVYLIAAMVAGFLMTVVLIPILRAPAERAGLVDHPGGRKDHEKVVPLVGGAAMFIAFVVALFILPQTLRPYASLVVGMGLLLATGIVDDAIDISPASKLGMQVFAAVLMVSWGEVQIHNLGNLGGFGNIDLEQWAIPFTVLCTLFMINAINMADGTDGLAGNISLVALVGLAAAGILNGASQAFLGVTLILVAVIAGFLCFNLRVPGRSHASVFMGDSGSMMLGFAIAWLAVYVSQKPGATVYPVTIAWILVLPVIDLVSLYFRRLMRGRSPFTADREHLHHILLRAGYAVTATVWLLTSVMVLFGLIGIFSWHLGWPEPWMFLGLVLVLVIHYLFATRAWTLMRMLKGGGKGRD